ncbi:MAG: GNAT family N-acetyltransferase [Pseudobdellovibrio sp.]
MAFSRTQLNDNHTKFYILDGQYEAARIDVEFKDKKCLLNYAFVDPKYRGQGLGEKIVTEALDILKSKMIEPIAVCGYVKKIMSYKK